MIVQITALFACQDCADIVSQGYTDGIDDCKTHQDRCNHIDKEVLPRGHYWLGDVSSMDEPEYGEKCDCCGIGAPGHIVRHAVNT